MQGLEGAYFVIYGFTARCNLEDASKNSLALKSNLLCLALMLKINAGRLVKLPIEVTVFT